MAGLKPWVTKKWGNKPWVIEKCEKDLVPGKNAKMRVTNKL